MTTFPLRCASKFKPQRLLARGGYGSVWLAIQEGLEREVALKLLLPDVLDNPEAIARFKHEARVTASLNHPGIVVVIDHDVEEGVPWIAYEYLPGGSLRRRLDLGTIPWREVVQIGIQMCAALEEMHGRGILHRDIKPENVLQAGLGRYKLTDFGIAKSSAAGVKTAVNVLLGTPTYMAPEQIVGLPYCVQSDLYALGILLFELLTGDPPFDSDDPTKVLEMHLDAEPPCPSRRTTGLPEELDDVVLRSLGKEASDRFADAAAMRLALEAIPVDPPPSAGGPAEAPGRSVKSGAPVPRPGRFHMFKARDTFRRLRGGGRVALALAVVLCAAALLSVGRPARTVVAPPAAPEPSVTLPGPRMAAAAAAVDAAKTCAVAWAGHLSHLEGRVLNTRIAETCRMMEGLARQFVERQGPLAAIVEELRTLGPDPSTLSLRTHSLLVQALAYRWILRCQLDFFRVRLKFCEKAEQYESAPWSIPAVAGGLYADMGSRACLTGLPEALAGCLGLQDRLARRPGPIGPALRSLCFDVAQVAEMSQRTRWQLEVKREVRDQVERFLASLDRVPEGRGRVIARIVRHHWDWGSALLPKLRKERADRARVDLDRLAGLLDRSETVQIDEMRQRLSVVRID